MTDFVDDLEAELLKAARRRASGRRRLRLRVPLRPALVLAAAFAAFVFVVRGGGPEPERQVTKPTLHVQTGLPVADEPASCGKAPSAQPAPPGGLDDISLLRRPRTAGDAVDGSRLPIATYDPDRTRRVGNLGVVPTGGMLDCATGASVGFGVCLTYGEDAARCFTSGEVRAGKAFAFVEEPEGARLIGVVPDGPTRVILTHRGAIAAPAVRENTVDDLFQGLRATDAVTLELERRTAKVAVINYTGVKGRAEIEATRLRGRLGVEVEATDTDEAREVTVVSSTSTHSNAIARTAAELLEAEHVELAPEGSDFKETTPGVIVSLGRDRMR
jgi:hypothetical protein